MSKPEAPFYSVALLSAAALSYEVLLIRLFSIIQWHHFAYMVISLALLGYGASGTFLAFLREKLSGRFAGFFVLNITAFSLASLLCYALAQQLRFNPDEILWDWRQCVRLTMVYLLLGFPFFFAANAIGMALSYFPNSATRIYAADLFGAGIGSCGIIGLLYLVFPETALKFISLLGFCSAGIAILEFHRKQAIELYAIAFFVVIVIATPARWLEPLISPYKSLSQTLNIPGAHVLQKKFSPLGLITVVENKQVPFRSVPGSSVNLAMEPPLQIGIFTDGDSMTPVTQFFPDRTRFEYLDYVTSALPYHLMQPCNVLILGAGGGSDVLQARFYRVKQIDAVELNPQVVRLMQKDYANFSGNLYASNGVRIHVSEGRGFIRRQKGRFDLIQLAVPGSFAASSSGLYSLNENYLFTVEAMQDYLRHLNTNGFLSITHWIKIPPRETLKLFATVVKALQQMRAPDSAQQLILVRGWQTGTLLVKNGRISSSDIQRLREFCEQRSFDLCYYPGMQRQEANRFNLLQDPGLFYDGARALLSANSAAFLKAYKFSINPPTDNQPYFFHFLKWSTMPELLGMYRRGGISLLESGYLVLIAALAQAIVLGFLVILVPLWIWRKKREAEHVISFRVALYFFFLGFAFFFMEIAFIQKFMLFLYHPIFAVTVSLSAFLLSAGLGSGLSNKWSIRVGPFSTTKIAVAAMIIIAAAQLMMIDQIFALCSGTSDLFRAVLSVLLVAPLGFCMGIPFPQALHALSLQSQSTIPWAWGFNGYASVLSAITASLIAIHFGFSALVELALLLYILALSVFPNRRGFS